MPKSASLSIKNVSRDLSLSDKVAEQLTEIIVSGQLGPGERLPSERELGDQFGVSRTVIREAVRSLSAKGLLRVTSGRGIEVGTPDRESVASSMRLFVRGRGIFSYSKVHEVRAALEVQATGLAAEKATAADVDILTDLCDRFGESVRQGDTALSAELDMQFHNRIALMADNELLSAMLDSISDILREVRLVGLNQRGAAESALQAHRWVVQCIAAKDPESARRAMERHLAESQTYWLDSAASGDRLRGLAN